jgi:hypothetical protein
VGSPAELPAVMYALKSQQFRWTKGAAETAKKNLLQVMKAKLPFGVKLHALFHLLNSTLFVCVIVAAIASVPLLSIKNANPQYNGLINLASIFVISTLSLIAFYWVSFHHKEDRKFTKAIRFAGTFPLFLAVSMGMSLHNALAVIEGYSGKKTPFIRTPKLKAFIG